ncbi:MAG: glycosyltransferase family 4 protein [Armatimonadota bacterium]
MNQPSGSDGDAPRVLMVLKRAGGYGGLQMQARRVAVRMAERELPVSIVAHTRRPLTRSPRWARQVSTTFLQAPEQWSFAWRLYRYLCSHRESYDLVHVHGFGLETFAAMAARQQTGRPLVVKPSVAGPGTKLHTYRRFFKQLPVLQRCWSPVDRWVSISEETAGDLLGMGVPESRIARVPNGVDTERFRPAGEEERARLRRRFGVGEGERVLCTVSRLRGHKRVDTLLGAFAEVSRNAGPARLWIIGKGPERGRLEAQIAASGLSRRVELLGDCPPRQVARRLRASDAFGLLSDWEGLPNALLEAMACGLPVLATPVSGSVDVVEDGVTGRLAARDDEPALRAALREVLYDEEARRLGKSAAAMIQERYSLDATVDRLQRLYAACLPAGSLSSARQESGERCALDRRAG